MARPAFPYTDEQNQHIQDMVHANISYGSTRKGWPEDWKVWVDKDGNSLRNYKPSKDSLRCRFARIEQYGIEGANWQDKKLIMQDWQDWEDDFIIQKYRECKGSVKVTQRVVAAIWEDRRSFAQIHGRIKLLQQQEKLERIHYDTHGKGRGLGNDVWIKRFEDRGFTVLDPIPAKISIWTMLNVSCSVGHIHKKQANSYMYGCYKCDELKHGTSVLYSEEYFEKNPKIANQLGVLYNNFMMHEEEEFIKVGITKGNIKTGVDNRYRNVPCTPYGYEKDETVVGTTLENWRSEQYLLMTVYPRGSSLQYKPNFKFSGWTECIVSEKREEVRKWFKEERIRRKAGIMPRKNILR